MNNEDKAKLYNQLMFEYTKIQNRISSIKGESFTLNENQISEIKNLEECDPVKKLIVEWCLDDKGINMLYKNNGQDRYPDFKLYKMIARTVNNLVPRDQLKQSIFKKYVCNGDISE